MKMVDRKTGAIVDIPDADAQAAFQSGKFGVPKGVELPVQTEAGRVVTVDPHHAQQAFDAAARVAPEEAFRGAQDEARYGGVGGTAKAAAIAAARGAGEAFGVPTDAAAIGFAGMPQGIFEGRHEVDPYKGERTLTPQDALREDLRGYQRVNPVTSVVGEIGGMAAAQLAGGGLVGQAGRVGGAVAGAVGRSAFEMGALGGVQAINEAALGDERITAGKIMAGVGHGAIIGAAFGGASRLASEALAGARDRMGRWIGTFRPKDIEGLAEKHFGYAPEGLGERVQQAYAKTAAAASGKDADTIAKFTAFTPEGAEARRIAVFDAPKVQEAAERAVRKHVDEILQAGSLVSDEAKGVLKAGYIRNAVKRGNEEAAGTYTSSALQKLINGAEAELGKEIAPSMVKSVETVSRLAYRAQEAAAAGDNALAFVELDNVKRGIQKLTSTGYRSLRAIADPVDQLNARRTVAWLDSTAEELRRGLEDSSLWGKAAEDQRVINAAWTKHIDASKRFHKSLTTEVGRDPANPYLDVRGADPAKVAGYVKGLTNPHNDLTHQAVRDFVDSGEELSKAIGARYDLPPDKLAEVQRVAEASKGFRGTIDEAEKSLVLANQFRELTERSSDSFGGLLGGLGFGIGGPVGGVVGTVAGAIFNPGKTISQLAAIERLTTKVDSEIATGVREFLSGAKPKQLGAPASTQILSGSKGEYKAFESKVGEVLRLNNNREELTARISEFTQQFEAEAPNIAAALTVATVKGIDYLARNAPPGFTPRPAALEWGIHEEPLYSDAEMRAWARRAAVVNDYRSAIDSMRRGMLTPEEADALREVHEPVFQRLQLEIKQQRIDRPKSMTYGQRLQLEVMFDVPLDRTLDPDLMHAIQETFSQPQMKPPPRRGLDINESRSKASSTVTQELEGGP